MDIRHIKITSTEGLYRINDKKAFRGLIVSEHLRTPMNLTASSVSNGFLLPPALGDGSVLPAAFTEGVLQGCRHHVEDALQTARAKQLTKQHARHHPR